MKKPSNKKLKRESSAATKEWFFGTDEQDADEMQASENEGIDVEPAFSDEDVSWLDIE